MGAMKAVRIFGLVVALVSPAQADLIDTPAQLAGASVVLIGEVHDNPDHHLWQAGIVAQLSPAGVVFEMLGTDQAMVDPTSFATLEAYADAIDWAGSGWPEFSLYRPIFAALGSARIYGAALPRETVRNAVMDGAAAHFPGDPARFGLDQALSEDQQSTREAQQMAAHCNALPQQMLGGMVAAQRLRDAELARQVLIALEEVGGPVVVILGNGHARRDWGVAHMLHVAAPGLEVVSVGQLEHAAGDTEPYDFWRVTAAVDRGDPCAVFN